MAAGILGCFRPWTGLWLCRPGSRSDGAAMKVLAIAQRLACIDAIWESVRCVFLLVPRTPPRGKPGWFGGKTGRAEGAAIAKTYAGGWGVCEKPGDCTPEHPANPHGSKQKCPTGLAQIPRVGLFSTRVGVFSTRVCFCGFAALFVSLFQITEEREERRGVEGGKARSTGFRTVARKQPRVWGEIHGFSGDAFLSKTQHWRGFEGWSTSIPGFLARNAYGWPLRALSWRGYGLCALD